MRALHALAFILFCGSAYAQVPSCKLDPNCITANAARIAAIPSNECFRGTDWVSADSLRACTPGARFADDFGIRVHESSTWFNCGHPDAPKDTQKFKNLCHNHAWAGPKMESPHSPEADAILLSCYNRFPIAGKLRAAMHGQGLHLFMARQLGLPRC